MLNILLDLAHGCEATLSIMEGVERRWVNVGPSTGEKMHYNPAVGTLRITVLKKKVASHNKQRVSGLNLTSRSTKAERRPKGTSVTSPQRKPDQGGMMENLSSGGFDGLGNPVDIDPIIVEQRGPNPIWCNAPVFENSPGVTQWTAACKIWIGTEYPPPRDQRQFQLLNL